MIIIYKCYFNVNWLYFIEQYKSIQFNSIQKKGVPQRVLFYLFFGPYIKRVWTSTSIVGGQ